MLDRSPKERKERGLFTSPQDKSRWAMEQKLRCSREITLKPPGTHTQQLLGGIECHRHVGRARRRSSAADPEGLHCTNGITFSMSRLTQFLKKQMALNWRISGTAYCGRLREVPRPEHTLLPCMGSPSRQLREQLGGGGQSYQAPDGQTTENWETPRWVQGLLRHLPESTVLTIYQEQHLHALKNCIST